jgi:hypothetical protein
MIKNILTILLFVLKIFITIKVVVLLYTSYQNSFKLTDELIWWVLLLVFDIWVMNNFSQPARENNE